MGGSAQTGGVRLAAGSPAVQPSLDELAAELFRVLSDGASDLRYNICRGFSLREAATRRPIASSYTPARDWRPARDVLPDGTEVDRTANPFVLLRHLRGDYDVAIEAPSWSSLLVLDIDLPKVAPVTGEHAQERGFEQALSAALRRDDVLGAVWRVFEFSTDRQPVILSSPAGGYHLYLPLCRDERRDPRQRPWPLRFSRQWLEHHLDQHRLGLQPGVLELYPTGVPLRAPCGRGTALLVPRNPSDSDDLQLELRHVAARRRPGGVAPARNVRAYVADFLARLEAARRPLEEWLSAFPDEPCWDAEKYGPFGRRPKKPDSGIGRAGVLSQDQEEVDHAPPQGGAPPSLSVSSPSPAVAGPLPPVHLPEATGSSAEKNASSLVASEAPGLLLRGGAYLRHVARLRTRGIEAEGTRHDAILKLTHFFGRVADMDETATLAELDEWLRGLPHRSATRARYGDGRFVRDSLREARQYYRSLARVPRRRRAAGRPRSLSPRTLMPADEALLTSVLPPECVSAGRAILAYLATFADEKGRVPGPVTLSTSMLLELCGETRVSIDGSGRARAYVVVMRRFLALGLVTIHVDYSNGRHGRSYCVWYAFGSGQVPAPGDDDRIELGQRPVREGDLVAVLEGKRARVVMRPRLVGCPADAWWTKMFSRRAFTPAEFFGAEERHILPGTFRDRRQAEDQPRVGPAGPPFPTPPASGPAPGGGRTGAPEHLGTSPAMPSAPANDNRPDSPAPPLAASAESVPTVISPAPAKLRPAKASSSLAEVVSLAWSAFERFDKAGRPRRSSGPVAAAAPLGALRFALESAEVAWNRARAGDAGPTPAARAAGPPPDARARSDPPTRGELAELAWAAFERLDPSDPRRQ